MTFTFACYDVGIFFTGEGVGDGVLPVVCWQVFGFIIISVCLSLYYPVSRQCAKDLAPVLIPGLSHTHTHAHIHTNRQSERVHVSGRRGTRER